MSKKIEEIEVIDEEVITDEETTALANRANMGEFLDSPSTASKLSRPSFVNTTKDPVNATLGKDKLQLLKAGESADVVIFQVDGLGFSKPDPANEMGPPIKFGSEQEALAAGERTKFTSDGIRPTVAPYRNLSMLVKCPGEVSPAFKVALAGAYWAACIYSCGKTAYYQNMPEDEGILDIIRFYQNNAGLPLYQLLWTVTPVLHTYKKTNRTAAYLKFTFKKKLDDKDPIFTEIQDAMKSGQ